MIIVNFPKYLILFTVCFFFSCKKSNVEIPHGTTTHYNQNSVSVNSNGPFSFTEISIDHNPVQKGNVAKVTANATGKNLSFKWSTPHGDIFGTGPTVYYSDSCVGTFQITCTVSDGTNTQTITVDITVID